MTTPSISPDGATSIGARLVFFTLGVLALAIGTLITLGAALAGVLSMGVMAWAVGRRGGRLTRRGAWLASVGGTIAVLAVVTGTLVLSDESSRRPMTAEERAQSQARAEEAMPDWMKAMRPNAARQTAAADSVANQLLQNTAVVVWAGLMGAVLASTMIGTIAGSFAWGGAMLLYRGLRGRWMPAAPQAA